MSDFTDQTPEPPVLEFTFFIDADSYDVAGAELAAEWGDLVEAGVERVDLPPQYPHNLADRIPVRVAATARGLRFYARLIHVHDPLQLADLERVIAAANARTSS